MTAAYSSDAQRDGESSGNFILEQVCFNCAKANVDTFLSCHRCNYAHYCSTRCCDEYRLRHEKYECDAFNAFNAYLAQFSQDISLSLEMIEVTSHLITTISAWITLTNSELIDTSNSYFTKGNADVTIQSINKLMSHDDKVIQKLHPIPSLLASFLPGLYQTCSITQEQLYFMIGINYVNSVQILDKEGGSRGVGLFPGFISSLNHSCHPNCGIQGDLIRTFSPIAEGEELLISYTPYLTYPTSNRQAILKDRFLFDCSCQRCRSTREFPFIFPQELLVNHSSTSELSVPQSLVPYLQKGGNPVNSFFAYINDIRYRAVETITTASSTPTLLNPERRIQSRTPTSTHNEISNLSSEINNTAPCAISTLTIDQIQQHKHRLSTSYHPLHYLLFELEGAERYCHAVVGNVEDTFGICRRELAYGNAFLPGGLISKVDLLNNMIRCTELAQSLKPQGQSLTMSNEETLMFQVYS